MRPFAVIFLLFVVGLAVWLIWDKLHAPKPLSPPAAQQIKDTEPAPIELTDSEHDLDSATDTKPSPPKPSMASKPETPPASLSSYLKLEHLKAQGKSCLYVRHTYYALCYSEEHEQALWTAYILEGKKLRDSRVRRTQDFRPDPKVPTQSAQSSDYKRSGYDRGHLVPAGDFKWDSLAMSETFYMSNMSPQLHEFNAGIWEEVESTVRRWARQKGRLVVYTGPVLDRVKERIGKSQVSVPRAFYKVVYHLDEKNPSGVAFLVPHAPSHKAPTEFLVPIDSVEKVTGIDFFPVLPDDIEKRIESRLERRAWEASPYKR